MSAIKTVKATINGVEHILTYNASTKAYEASITAPSKSSFNVNSGHYYPVTVTAEDVAGNRATVDDSDETLGASLKLKVKEKTAPVATFTSIGNNAVLTNNTPAITFKVTDNDSGVNTSSVVLKVDGTAVNIGTATAVTGGFSWTYTPSAALADGSHTLQLTASDNDGNACAAVSLTFKIDTVPPTLNVSNPINEDVVNTANINVVGKTNDITSSPCTVSISLNGVNQGTVTISSDGSFTKAITLADGINTIVIASTDKAGKVTTITRTITLDTTIPVFSSITCTPNPVDAGATYKIVVKVES